MKQINVDIAPDGSVEIDAVGFSGPDCEQATRFLEEALGTAVSKTRKPEYRRRAALRRTQSLGQGGEKP
jgi:hypothetical protein